MYIINTEVKILILNISKDNYNNANNLIYIIIYHVLLIMI